MYVLLIQSTACGPQFTSKLKVISLFLLLSLLVTICWLKGRLRGWYSLLSASAISHSLPQSHTYFELTIFLYILVVCSCFLPDCNVSVWQITCVDLPYSRQSEPTDLYSSQSLNVIYQFGLSFGFWICSGMVCLPAPRLWLKLLLVS